MDDEQKNIEKLLSHLDEKIAIFSDDVEAVKCQYGKFAPFSGIGPTSPYYDKYSIYFILQYLRRKKVDTSKYYNDFKKVLNKLNGLEIEKGRGYRELLYNELIFEVDAYPNDFLANFKGGYYEEADQELFARKMIEILIMELENDFDLSEVKKKVAEGDRELKEYIQENMETWEEEFGFTHGNTYYPERFWWDYLPESLY